MANLSFKKVEIYTDGACLGNPGPGGWAALLRYQNNEKILSGAEKLTTNNRMELTAPIKALSTLNYPCKVIVTTDSKYVINGITQWIEKWIENSWKSANKKPIKNIDLWQLLWLVTRQHSIQWCWIKGHSGHPENELVDYHAQQIIHSLKL